jgi:hypothetical protein
MLCNAQNQANQTINNMKYTFYMSIFLMLIIGCSRRPSRVEQALTLAGDNHTELETVLAHYSKDPADSLKYRAACFLIENMPGKRTLDTLSVAANQPYFDALAEYRRNQGRYSEGSITAYRICDSVKEHTPAAVKPEPKYTHDLKTVTTQFLIRHIDRAFDVRQASPWGENISFDTFCRFVLPYKTKEHLWEDSYSYFRTAYASLPDSIAGLSATGKYINLDIQGSFLHGGSFFHDSYPFLQPITFRNLIETRIGVCMDICCTSIEALHSLSIPAAIDIIPYWGNTNDRHFLCELIADSIPNCYDNTQRIYTKPDDELIRDMFWSNGFFQRDEGTPPQVNLTTSRTVPKIFREGYALQYESLFFKAGKEEIPTVFRSPCLEDITSRYLVCSDVTVSLDKPDVPRKFAYLCCYNPDRENPAPVDWAPVKRGKAVFRDVGINILYFPAYCINGRMEPAGTPFVLLAGGECQYMTPLQETHEQVVLYGKVPYRSYIMRYASKMRNGRFQVANRPDMSDTTTVHTIHATPFYEQSISIEQAPPGRYALYRFAGMEYGEIAEMEFWGLNASGEEEKLEGRLFGNLGTYTDKRAFVTDGDRVTYFSPQKEGVTYIGIDFGTPRRITRIRYCPRSDDNGIMSGELYELFYWDNGCWISLGKQEGRSDHTLVYTNVPKGALLNIHNHTRGKENRPFTYENGKQIWW